MSQKPLPSQSFLHRLAYTRSLFSSPSRMDASPPWLFPPALAASAASSAEIESMASSLWYGIPSDANTRMADGFSSPSAGHGHSCGMSSVTVRLCPTLVMIVSMLLCGCHVGSYLSGRSTSSSQRFAYAAARLETDSTKPSRSWVSNADDMRSTLGKSAGSTSPSMNLKPPCSMRR